MKPTKPAVVCSNSSCSTPQTSSKTFRIYEGLKYCNACALYLHKYDQQRPESLIMKAESGTAARCQKHFASSQGIAFTLTTPLLAQNAKNTRQMRKRSEETDSEDELYAQPATKGSSRRAEFGDADAAACLLALQQSPPRFASSGVRASSRLCGKRSRKDDSDFVYGEDAVDSEDDSGVEHKRKKIVHKAGSVSPPPTPLLEASWPLRSRADSPIRRSSGSSCLSMEMQVAVLRTSRAGRLCRPTSAF